MIIGRQDSNIEITAIVRGLVLDQTGILADIEEVLESVEFRDESDVGPDSNLAP